MQKLFKELIEIVKSEKKGKSFFTLNSFASLAYRTYATPAASPYVCEL